MPRRRAVIVSSCEPCASAMSKSRPFAQRLQRAEPVRHLPRLLEARAAAVPADHLGGQAVQLEQLQRLRVVARRDLHLVAALLEDPDQRPEHEHVRARGHVDPDLHRRAAPPSAPSAARGGSCSTWRSYQSVNASSPQSWRLQSCAPATCSSSRRVTGAGSKNPCERSVSGESVSRANGCELAAQPRRRGDREAALAPVHDLARQQRLGGLAQQHLLREPAHLVLRGQREREVRHDRVEERHARLERVRHRRAVGLHEQVVDEVDPEVDVLEARELVGALGLRVARAVDVDRVERAASAAQLRAQVRREDLLPAVMALERRQVRGADEPLRLVVEARLRGRASAGARRAGARAARAARRGRRADRRRTCSSRRRARRRPRPRARPSRAPPRAARRGTSAARTSRRTARRTPRRAPAAAAAGRAARAARGGSSRSARRRAARRRARRSCAPRSRS